MLAALAGTSLLGQTFTGSDVGAPTHPGGVTNNVDGTISVNGGGDDIWNATDNFFYYYTAAAGQIWDARMRVISFTGPDYWSKVELMVRRPQTPGGAPAGGDPELNVCATQISQQDEVRPQWRGARNAASTDAGGTGIAPNFPNQWLRLTRVGSVFTTYESQNGTTWTRLFSQDTAVANNTFDGTVWEDPILVGAAVTAHNMADVNGATAVVSNLSLYPFTAPTAAGVVTQIQQFVIVRESTEASFRFAATNNANPGDLLAMNYSWYKNNVLVSTNPMGPDFTFLTTAADNNAQVYAVASVQAPYSSISVTSAVSTLTVTPPSVIYTNGLKQEFFAGAPSSQAVEEGSVGPGVASLVSAADIGNYGANYVVRLSGYFIPPTTTAYNFFINSDDNSELFLSTDSSQTNKHLIAQEELWSNPHDWLTSDATGGNPGQKRSDMWSPDGGSTVPYSAGIYLTGGQLYWLEAVVHQGGGGANLAVTYQTTNEMADPNWVNVFTNGVLPRLAATNNNIAIVTSPTTTLTWTTQPTNLTVFEGSTANFFSKASSDSELALAYQWYVNNAPFAGATGPTLSLPLVPTTYNGATIFVVANTAEAGLSITSSVATLNVQQAVFEPGFAKDERWDGANRAAVENGTVGAPGYTMAVPGWAVSLDNGSHGNNFARRVSGFFIPPTSGLYDFFVNSDDDSDLFVSTDNTAAHKRLVAQESGWSNPLDWNGVGGGSTVAQKRSDQFSPDGGATHPYANGISLTAGQRYYVEQDYAQGGGGANLAATFKIHLTDPDPGNGAPTRMVGNTIGINAVRCSYVAFTQEPANATVPPFGYAAFTAVGVTDSQLAIGQTSGGESSYTNNFIFYQWYKNGVAVAGANSSTYVIDPVQPADNAATITCQIRALGFADNTLTPIWSNSTPATLTVSPQAVFEPGWAYVEWWDTNGPSRVQLEANTLGPAHYFYATPRFETSINQEAGDNYVNRIAGFFVPPVTGDYVFFMNSDDDADLFISTNSSPAHMHLVAQESGWAGSALGWTSTGGGGDTLAQRRSDQWTDPVTGTQPYSAGIHLLAGQMYYMEGDHHEGGGGDYFAATYKLLTDPDPVNGEDSTLMGNAIGFYAARIPWVAFSQQPSGTTVTSGGNSATFIAKGFSAPSLMPGTTGDPRPIFGLPATNVVYQWYRNGTPISGATGSSYTLVPILPQDNAAQFVCGIRALGYADNSLNPIYSNSATAVLTVVTDTVPPTITYAATIVNTNGPAPLYIVDVTFSEWMDASTISNLSNYSVSGATVTNIVIASNHRTVELDLNQPPTFPLNVTVNNVHDLSGNPIAANSSAPLQPDSLTYTDVGTPGVDPAYPSMIWVDGLGGYIISAEGSDIWANADGFNYAWEQKTNDFDVVVRTVRNGHTSNWAKAGLMVREDLTPGSRNWNIVNDPLAADGIMAPDGSGFGANAVECNMRDTANGASGGWENLGGGIVPAYPNAWVRLKRTGNVLDAFYSVTGVSWGHLASYNTSTNVNGALSNVVYVGICTTAHNNDPVGTTPPPPFLYYNNAEYANYNSSFVAAGVPTVSVVHSGSSVTVSWSPAGGHLESRSSVTPGAPWTVVGTSNPVTLPLSPGSQFFRVVNP